MRATASVPPPAPQGTISVIGRSGQVWACAPQAASSVVSNRPRRSVLKAPYETREMDADSNVFVADVVNRRVQVYRHDP